VTVAVNLGSEMQALPCGPHATHVLLASAPGVALANGGVRLPADAVAVLGPEALRTEARAAT
jgi:hypothetical protein